MRDPAHVLVDALVFFGPPRHRRRLERSLGRCCYCGDPCMGPACPSHVDLLRLDTGRAPVLPTPPESVRLPRSMELRREHIR